MTQEEVPRVPNVWVQLSAKWAGSGKISGCGDRRIYCSITSDDNKDNNWAASKYLKVLFRSNNYKRRTEYYQKWNYWNFDFSPNKNEQIRTQNLEGTGKEVWKERWKTISDTKIILLIEGIVQVIGRENSKLLNWSIFFRRVRIIKLEGVDLEVWLERRITPANKTYKSLFEGTNNIIGWKDYILLNWSIFHRVDTKEVDVLYLAKDEFSRCDQQEHKEEYWIDSYVILGRHRGDQRIDSLHKSQDGPDEELLRANFGASTATTDAAHEHQVMQNRNRYEVQRGQKATRRSMTTCGQDNFAVSSRGKQIRDDL